MQIYHLAGEANSAVLDARGGGKITGLVPTMGALHAGHESLIRQSVLRCDQTFVSVYVNPTQFGPGEDLEAYPRPIADDLAICRRLGVNGVLVPDHGQIYPGAVVADVTPPPIAALLEGEKRPGHFAGVCSVVRRLFDIMPVDFAFFGKKDYQQFAVLSAMVKQLELPIQMVGCEIVRDFDSLALSSRNAYLSDTQRSLALAIPRTLNTVVTKWRLGQRDAAAIEDYMAEQLAATDLQYATIRDAETFGEPIPGQKSVALIAAKVGTTRLIDNVELLP